VDLREGLITANYNLIVNDSALQTIWNGIPHVYQKWAEKDAPFPYLVHFLDLNSNPSWALFESSYSLHIFDYGDTSDRIWKIRRELIRIFDQNVFQINQDGEAVPLNSTVKHVADGVRVYLMSEELMDEQEQNIWHYFILFNLRLGRTGDICQILK